MKAKKEICPYCKKEIKEESGGFCQDPKKTCVCFKKKTATIGFGFCR